MHNPYAHKTLLIKTFIITLFLFMSIPAHSHSLDSLYVAFCNTKGETQVITANEIIIYGYENDLTDSLITLKTSDEQAVINAIVYEIMGFYYTDKKANYVKSIDFFNRAISNYEKTGNVTAVNTMNGCISTDYGRMGNYEKAVEYMLKCYEWEKSLNDQEKLSSTLNNLGVIYSQWQKRDMAIRYFEEAERVERLLNRPLYYANRLASLAKEYSLVDAKKALPLIKKALHYDQQIDSESKKEDRLAAHNIILGDIYYELDSLKNSENCYRKSLELFEENGRTFYVATTLLALGRLQLKQKQYNEAIASLKQSNEIAEKNNLLRIQRDACRFLSEAYSKLEPNALSYFYLKKYTAVNDSIFKEATQQQINDFQIKYETAEKQLEIERQSAEIANQKAKQLIYVGGLITAGLLLILLVYIVTLRTRRAREFAEANAMKDKFFSIISHDIKNPVVAQRDSLQILAENADKLPPQTVAEYYQKLLKSANGLVDLLKNLLDWARIQIGRETYYPLPFDMITALQTDINIIKSMAEQKNITFETLLPEKAVIDADENMFVIAVRNLLTNAVKFTAKGGKIILEISPCSNSKYLISIADTGIGMSEKQLNSMFRLDKVNSQTGTAGEKGTGLGLIVCKEMIEKQSSHLHIESEEGKGSKFWFEL